ncbi:Dienelactone hydrolase [Rhodopseudomonas palustris HaA2]|uniref:Dienelactone hydrolase n=1 Tax=Rhodopseudomonas palustris (strain HaA2) TaxID=316058 RepID=Q2ISF5_RHOP2|nr:dienelactone hydrolase family protein [Rhodopseudomonas palustris]ABD08855.1 Dienelactone hydrolase [Rhodopseudomonas palustris HaA2]
MIEQQIEIPTLDGRVSTFITHPERNGPHPVVLLFMDAPGIREELRDMARRLGTCGYYVMLPSLYYRSDVFELGPIPADDEAPERKRMYELMGSLSIAMVMQDAKALLDFSAMQPAASKGPAGAVGYCMSGRYAISAATHFPDRVKAAASIYGTHLVTDAADSPHRTARKASGELYFACAETDRWAPPEMIATLRESLAADGVDAEVEIYPGTQHAFAFPQRPVYNREAAERHWERLLALYRRRLQG